MSAPTANQFLSLAARGTDVQAQIRLPAVLILLFPAALPVRRFETGPARKFFCYQSLNLRYDNGDLGL